MLGGALPQAICSPECGVWCCPEVLPHLSVIEELDTVPIVEELSKAIDYLASGKVPGKDGIPPEI